MGQFACHYRGDDYEEDDIGDGVVCVTDGWGVCAVWTGVDAERYH